MLPIEWTHENEDEDERWSARVGPWDFVLYTCSEGWHLDIHHDVTADEADPPPLSTSHHATLADAQAAALTFAAGDPQLAPEPGPRLTH